MKSRFDFLRDRFGEGSRDKILAALGPADRDKLAGEIAAGDWYPFELIVGVDRAIAQAYGGEETLEELGARSAEFHLGTLYRNFAQTNAPHGFFRNASLVHQLYHDRGSMEYGWVDDRGCNLRVFGPDVDTIYCKSAIGYFRRAAALCGGEGARVTKERCRTRGDGFCEYRVTW